MLFPYVPRASFAIRHGGSVPETPTKVRLHLSDERRYRLLKLLCEQPQASQRQLSQALGVSVGSLNYAVNALIDRGWVKANNFRNSRNKLAYAYLLTPSGIDAKARIAVRFLKRKMDEYEALEQEIAQLKAEVAEMNDRPSVNAHPPTDAARDDLSKTDAS